MTAKGVARSIKNYANGFSTAQVKVRKATSNDPWGPSGTLMNEIAQMTFNKSEFVEIMDMIDRRLNDKGKNWRHVFKALLLLDYCLHVGSENVVLYAKENIYVIKTLKEFQHVDESGKDVGANVRQKAKDITALLMDENRLKEERQSRQQMRDKMGAVNDYMNDALYGPDAGRNIGGSNYGSQYGRSGPSNEDIELQRALEESRRMAREDEQRRKQSDEDLAKALTLSEEEAREKERRQREKLERENEKNLFGEPAASTNPFPVSQTFGSSFNPYLQQQQQQQQLLQQQQQQQLLPQPQPQWPQPTGMTGISFQDPISANVQNTGFGNNLAVSQQPWGQYGQGIQAQMTGFPQQAQFTGMAPFQPASMTGMMPSQSPYLSTQSPPQFTSVSNTLPVSTTTTLPGSNNPFGQASSLSQLQPPQQVQVQNTGAFGSLSQSSQATGFTSASSPSFGHSSTLTTQSSSLSSPVHSAADARHAKLNALLAAREDGQDTFGNTGNLRIPVGTGFANSLKVQPTGTSNPSGSNLLVSVDSDTSSGNNTSTFSQSFGQSPSRNPFAPSQPQTVNTGFPGQQQQPLQPQFTSNFF